MTFKPEKLQILTFDSWDKLIFCIFAQRMTEKVYQIPHILLKIVFAFLFLVHLYTFYLT